MLASQIETEPLSPARKAWLTRRAKEEARADIETRKVEAAAAAAAPSPLAGEKIVSFYCEDPRIGYGTRLFVPVDIGPKWVTLFYAPRLLHTRVERLDFEKHARPAAGSSPRKHVGIIREAMRIVRSCYPDECELACRRGERAIAFLRSRS